MISTYELILLLKEIAYKIDNEFFNRPLGFKIKTFLNIIRLEIDWGYLLKKRLKNKVFLSTIHGVKGLEFDYVLIVGTKDKSFFKEECNNSTPYIEKVKEKKNLLYVGITRAKKEVILYYVKYPPNHFSQIIFSCLLSIIKEYIKYFDENYNEINFDLLKDNFCNKCVSMF
ncbi:MAG: 3'-5' exonuclease [Candidatus Helarchaeota archaeon]